MQIADLFGTDWEKVVERMTFLIRKKEWSYDWYDENTFSIDTDYLRRYYCLNDFGIDVFIVEDMRTSKELHFIISYEELKDYLLPTETDTGG